MSDIGKKIASLAMAALIFVLNANLCANAADYTVPGTNPTLDSAIDASNAAGGSNTLGILADQTLTTAPSYIIANLAMFGNDTTNYRVINLNGAHPFRFSGGGDYSVQYLTFTNGHGNDIGGAIYVIDSTITIDSTIFDSNSATNRAGAFYNNNSTATITNTIFTNNSSPNNGGAVYTTNNGTTNISDSTFTGNKATGTGGAVLNFNATTNISNTTFDSNTANNGGAVSNVNGKVTIDGGSFTSNKVGTAGGAVFNNTGADIVVTNSTFDSNSAGRSAGAIHNQGNSAIITNNTFTNNSSDSNAGAVYTRGTATVDNNTFSNNTAAGVGGALANNGQVAINNNIFDSNSAANGGAIANGGTATISNGATFTNNSASSMGGAIYNTANGTLNLDTSGDIIFQGNTQGGTPNDIYNDGTTNILENGNLSFTGGVDGKNTGVINKNGSGTVTLEETSINKNYAGAYNQTAGTLTTYSDMFGGVNTISDSNLNLWYKNDLTTNYLNLNNVNVNSITNTINTTTVNNFIVGPGGANFAIDINGDAKTSDAFIGNAGIYAGHPQGNINVSQINIWGAPTDCEIPLQIFTLTGLDDTTFSETIGEVDTPIYRYKFEHVDKGLYRLFRDCDPIFNPQAFRGQVATLAHYYNQLVVNNVLFDHVYIDSEVYGAYDSNRNKYAAINPLFAPYQYHRDEGSVWFKSYATFERIFFTEDLDPVNNAYGAIIGNDYHAINLGRGWKLLPSTYLAYNGGHQKFNDVSMYQNGGQGGFLATFNKKDFIGSILGYAGGYGNEMSINNVGVKDATGNWFAGCAAKVAYNLRASRHLIIQPNALISYNIFGRQDWNSDFGQISMVSGFLNGINVAPGVNVIYGRETWNAYYTFQYMFNINDRLRGEVNGVQLPDIQMRPNGYLETGVGIMKTFRERLMTYAQFVFRQGGRRGVGLQFGLMWTY